MSHDKVNEFLQDFARWASSRTDILGVALVGSHAKQAAKEASDVDLVVIADHPDVYLKALEWTRRVGEVQRQQIEDYGKLTSVRVWYARGLEVEYGITDESWAALPLDEGTRQVISGGMGVLFERGNILSRLQPSKQER